MDLIDRQAAIDAIKQKEWLTKDAKEVLQEAIEQLPSADIDLSGFSDKLWQAAYERGKADAVRCKDCKKYDTHNHRCKHWNHGVVVMDYCSRGERKDV